MKKTIALTLIFLSVITGRIAAQDNREVAEAKIRLAIKLMDEGVYDESLKLLEEAEALDAGFAYICTYERAYLYYSQSDYRTSIKLLKKCLKHDEVTDMAYQMLGNAYDMSGNPKKALSTYDKGRKRFPGSGKLYKEAGIIYYNRGDYNTALQYFVAGTEVEPRYPSNWFDIANTTIASDNKALAMLYGETAMCLEPNSRRTKEMGTKLFEAYRDNITFPGDSTVVTDFSDNTLSLPGNIDDPDVMAEFKFPFPISYEVVISQAVGECRSIDLSSLIEIRRRFIEIWFSDDVPWHEDYSTPLFDYHRALIEAGHFEAYNQWLFSSVDKAAFEMWLLHNEEAFDAFARWFSQNPVIE